jgi:hypothetical protein
MIGGNERAITLIAASISDWRSPEAAARGLADRIQTLAEAVAEQISRPRRIAPSDILLIGPRRRGPIAFVTSAIGLKHSPTCASELALAGLWQLCVHDRPAPARLRRRTRAMGLAVCEACAGVEPVVWNHRFVAGSESTLPCRQCRPRDDSKVTAEGPRQAWRRYLQPRAPTPRARKISAATTPSLGARPYPQEAHLCDASPVEHVTAAPTACS